MTAADQSDQTVENPLANRPSTYDGFGGPWRILFSPVRFGEAAALQEGVCDHCHQRVAVQAMPRAAFEVVEAQFFLELLMRLLADPSRLDRGGERLEVGLCRQVGR
jgi:hypothetical protein